ncbi:hypothetical protein, variant [Aphanomyces astaci]|uniref:GH18 domain-containing protein n=1 Tax=Aphanomyces astaci TaxID=112090 RepID=W4GL42_APHAT|nr:hypothetical protein H257_06714 [Aphanomyces astaci]XP_009830339.1 hypothetical protein, variant [Aphanomyces astaci]ETV80414.1 hypothetical protein H257_06714 [Aphanomyces astaci]ETV80415.1 hypothetical protein, variant [Aphanomyces astaci]|eukprot:XP_009830338.1 hypothetical protein H257_06714 [Aphanomyces astaci]
MSKLTTYRTPGYDDEPPRSPQLSTDDDDDTGMHPRDLDDSFAVMEASRIPKPDRNSIPNHGGEVTALKPSILHCWPLLFGLLYLAGTGFGVSKLVKAGWIDPEYGNATYAQYREDSVIGESCRGVDHAVPWRELKRKLKRCRRHEYYDPMHDDCHLCPAATPEDKIFAVFWETQKDCTRLVEDLSTRYVTHVMWSFAEPLDDGTINTKLQFWDDEHIRDCIGQLRMRCIKSMIAVGGASFRERFLPLKSPDNLARFTATAVQLVQLYDFDGIDIDDETGNMVATGGNWLKSHGPTVVSYLTALREGLDAVQHPDEPRYLLSWDEFPYAWDPPQPDNANYVGCIRYTEGEDGWHRCYEPRISNLVDFVNVMFYNINGGEAVYRAVIEDTLPNKAASVIPKDKIVVGACCGMGCVTLQPPGQEVFNAGNGSAYYKGTMLWSSTIDILYENSSSTHRMGRAGNYGVKMPFRMPPP